MHPPLTAQGAVYKTGPNPLGYNINGFYIRARNSLACSPCTVLLKITKVSALLAPDESFVYSTGVTASFPPTSGLVYLPSPIGSMAANTYWTLLFSTSGPQFAWSYVQNGTAPDGPEISDTGWTLAGLSQFDFFGATLPPPQLPLLQLARPCRQQGCCASPCHCLLGGKGRLAWAEQR